MVNYIILIGFLLVVAAATLTVNIVWLTTRTETYAMPQPKPVMKSTELHADLYKLGPEANPDWVRSCKQPYGPYKMHYFDNEA